MNQLTNSSIYLVFLSIMLLTGCSSVKPKITDKQLGIASMQLAYADICRKEGVLEQNVTQRYQRYVMEDLSNYQYDNTKLSNQYNLQANEINKDSNLKSSCNRLKLMTLKADQDRIQRQQANAARNEALASLSNSANSVVNAARNASNTAKYTPNTNPSVSFGSRVPSNNSSSYLIKGNNGLVHKTCTGSGSYRYCF